MTWPGPGSSSAPASLRGSWQSPSSVAKSPDCSTCGSIRGSGPSAETQRKSRDHYLHQRREDGYLKTKMKVQGLHLEEGSPRANDKKITLVFARKTILI